LSVESWASVYATRQFLPSPSSKEDMSGESESRDSQSVSFDRARVDFASLPATHASLKQRDSTDPLFHYHTPSSRKLEALSSIYLASSRDVLIYLRIYTDALKLVDAH
jgi:hypothetical protein